MKCQDVMLKLKPGFHTNHQMEKQQD